MAGANDHDLHKRAEVLPDTLPMIEVRTLAPPQPQPSPADTISPAVAAAPAGSQAAGLARNPWVQIVAAVVAVLGATSGGAYLTPMVTGGATSGATQQDIERAANLAAQKTAMTVKDTVRLEVREAIKEHAEQPHRGALTREAWETERDARREALSLLQRRLDQQDAKLDKLVERLEGVSYQLANRRRYAPPPRQPAPVNPTSAP